MGVHHSHTVNTVDEFVAALSAQASRDASEPVDITIDGYTGKAITLHIPDDADYSERDQNTFGTWDCGESGQGVHRPPGVDPGTAGRLAPVMLGDVTILSGDVTDATPDEIRAMTVIATIVGGRVAYCSDPAVCGED